MWTRRVILKALAAGGGMLAMPAPPRTAFGAKDAHLLLRLTAAPAGRLLVIGLLVAILVVLIRLLGRREPNDQRSPSRETTNCSQLRRRRLSPQAPAFRTQPIIALRAKRHHKAT
jgi:hypothetical protein